MPATFAITMYLTFTGEETALLESAERRITKRRTETAPREHEAQRPAQRAPLEADSRNRGSDRERKPDVRQLF
jgi:hypothetical protein